jgi:GDP-L-fucose synthase
MMSDNKEFERRAPAEDGPLGVHPSIKKAKLGLRRGIPFRDRILVLGERGFLGHHLMPMLDKEYPLADIIPSGGTSFFDITQQVHIRTMFSNIANNRGPIYKVVNLAALSGGMFDNSSRPASYWYQNTAINLNVLEECAKKNNGVNKLIMFIGGCSYPNDAESPIAEDKFMTGKPNENSLGYSFAKLNAFVGAWAYAQQFNLDVTVLVPTNLIGEWDNADEDNSHVAMGLIQRFVEAKADGLGVVTVYGSGKPVRDFIYAGDVAELVPFFLDNYPKDVGPVNLSTGIGTSIAELAELIAKAVGFDGKIHFDLSKPDGQMTKILDNTKLMNYLKEEDITWTPTPIEEAVQKTVDWYIERVWKK